ncbi:MAG TPA: Na+/H+ antiporter NhaA [Chitinophagaceae bacterium]|nr:Na+/H+ antiporter NhaA [Chitinophagaceae bacterium]
MKTILKKAINPLRFFLNDSRSVGVILLLCTVLSLVLSNSLIGDSYRQFWTGHIIAGSSSFHLPLNFGHWINDFLMAFFFLLAGMEIKRELIAGELSSFKKAVLPFGAALGGMIVPALIFLAFNINSGFEHGWGIPTATDIAFSLGVASLFGKRVPVGLKILLMALAIIDDLGAIIVIALFYGGKVHGAFLVTSAVIYLLIWACNIFKIKFGFIQIILSLLLWLCMLNSGIEASITGVLVAFAMPVNMLPKIEKKIHLPVNFIIIPLFALANTAILIPGNIIGSLNTTVAMGVIAGLVIGKPIGIFLFSRLLITLKIAKLPQHVNWQQILCMGTLAGIGFTMSIFTTALAFKDDYFRDIAKIAILFSMVFSVVITWLSFRIVEFTSARTKQARQLLKPIPSDIALN